MTLTLASLGFLAGALTMLAGQGGGLVLLLSLARLAGPHAALALTAPALLVGNVHRAWLCRGAIPRSLARTVAAASFPGAVVGGLVAGSMPSWALRVALVMLTLVAILRASGRLRFTLSRRSLGVGCFGVGCLCGTSGGAGVLVGPLLLSAGLSGPAYIGSTAVAGSAIHLGRTLAYGSVGMFDAAVLPRVAVLVAAILAGNFTVHGLRSRISASVQRRIEWTTLLVCVVLAVADVRR